MMDAINECQASCLYVMEFMMIPAVLMDVPPHRNPDVEFRVRSINELREVDQEIAEGVDWSAMSVSYYTSDELKFMLFEFPLPLEEPLAYYGMVIKYKGEAMAYYTLEMSSQEGKTYFCKCTNMMHSLIKPYEGELSALAFMQYVLDYHKKKC